jgi:hypothetical protein
VTINLTLIDAAHRGVILGKLKNHFNLIRLDRDPFLSLEGKHLVHRLNRRWEEVVKMTAVNFRGSSRGNLPPDSLLLQAALPPGFDILMALQQHLHLYYRSDKFFETTRTGAFCAARIFFQQTIRQ